MGKKKDLTDMKFERLTVLYEAPPHYTSGGNRKVMWHCRCDCGKELDVHSGALLNGSSKSCGCYSRDIASKNMSVKNKKYNKYDLSGDYGVGWTTNTNKEFYFDLEDYDKIKDYAWAEHHASYICTHDKQHKWMLLHKLIMNDLENNYDVDHIKTEHKFDNRKSNLRIATRSENNRNKIMQKNNTSGVTGVHRRSYNGKWRADIRVNRKRIDLGDFDNFEDAVKARKEAEEKYFGEWSYDNSQKIAEESNKSI